jgi:hypothetical protein
MARGKILPNALDIDLRGGLTDEVTPHAGSALLVELGRRSRVMEAAEKYLPAKKNPKGLGQGQMVESFVLLSALGGDCVEDFDNLRRDRGLAALLGYDLPAASTARQWLERGFHEESALADRPLQGSFIPAESVGLVALRAVLNHSVQAFVAAVASERQVTLDVDAHLVESSKREALATYQGFRGYQPLLVVWAQTGLVLADEFRDGNVPASKDLARLVDEAYEALPYRADGWEVCLRADAAAYEQALLDHWHGRDWTFAVSADMSVQLRAEIERLPLEAWHFWEQEASGLCGSGRKCPLCRAAAVRSEIFSPTAMWLSACAQPKGCYSLTGRR